jgi:gliding motility-associated-like protein
VQRENSMKRILLLFLTILLGKLALATHNRAGEITYRWINGNQYEITVTTYTKASSQADRCDLVVYFGDGDSATFARINGPSDPNCLHMGDPIGNDTKKNLYVGTHIYPGPGTYWISVLDPNRNSSIQNIPNSVNVPFYIRTMLVLNPFLGGVNNSPALTFPPIDYACAGQCFYHNPGAIDPDGDSLVYSLVPCLGDQGQVIPGYTFPPTIGGGTNAIDPVTGEYNWCSPAFSAQGEWNIAILIEEYRKLSDGSYALVGAVLRDMQIYVIACSNNPPVISSVNDTCIMAGTTLTLQVNAFDPVDNNAITLSATGAPFQASPPATFTSSTTVNPTGTFTWTPQCGHIRNQPYQVTFKAEDTHPNIPLVDFEAFSIKVVGPPPLNVTASPQGTSILVDWDPSVCASEIVKYLVYRKESCDPWIPGPCELGVPSYTGYTLIGNTAYNITSFNDNGGGQGLIHGVDYSYIIVAVYGDGSQGYASQQVCARLVRDVPIITHVTVDSTSTSIGEITIRWVKPVADADNLDTIAKPGPYRFELMRAVGTSTSFVQVTNFSSQFFGTLNDTSYVDTLLDTQNDQFTYKINFYYSQGGTLETLLGSTHTASSVYLKLTPADNQLTLSWQELVPWSNYIYHVYKETSPNVFTFLASTANNTYVDTGLVNGATYCYKVISEGEYSDTTIIRPLLNHSEIMCGEPQDLTPPCAPALTILPDCNIGQNYLVWTNPNNYCSDDVVQYNIYFTPVQGGTYTLLTSIPGPTDTDYVYVNQATIAGCYVITALDTFMNESPYSAEVCIDNCPVYELPNVFTPDGDNVNDFFIPFPYRFVESIDLKVYDRWGVLMFETTDPAIRWDGTSMQSKKPCTAGVYYYTCVVNEIRVTGIQQRMLKGFIHLFPGNKNPQ